MEIRKILKSERDQFVNLEFSSFGEKIPAELDEKYLGLADPACTFGAFVDGKIVAGLRILPLQQSLRGVLKNMGGIACVATYPEYRGQGIVLPMMKAAFNNMQHEKQSVSMLAAFKQSFYSKFDYVPVNPAIFLNVPRQSFKAYRHLPKDDSWELERVKPNEGKQDFFRFMREVAPQQYHGSVIYENITESEWNYNNKNTTMLFVRKNGRLEAIARAETKGFMSHGELILNDMFWRDRSARERLFQFIGLYWDQAFRIKLQVPFNCNFFHWFSDPEAFFKSNVPSTPWMVRIIDPLEAFKDIPVQENGQVTFRLSDPLCRKDICTYTLKSVDGVLQINKSSETPDLTASIKGLSALLYGTADIEELIYSAYLPEMSRDLKTLLSTWFPVKTVFKDFDF